MLLAVCPVMVTGHLVIACTPLFTITSPNEIQRCWSDWNLSHHKENLPIIWIIWQATCEATKDTVNKPGGKNSWRKCSKGQNSSNNHVTLFPRRSKKQWEASRKSLKATQLPARRHQNLSAAEWLADFKQRADSYTDTLLTWVTGTIPHSGFWRGSCWYHRV